MTDKDSVSFTGLIKWNHPGILDPTPHPRRYVLCVNTSQRAEAERITADHPEIEVSASDHTEEWFLVDVTDRDVEDV